jgi:hypothetical protein
MGASRIRCGLAWGRSAALGIACAALAGPATVAAQARSPASDKPAARGLAGSIVQFEETGGRAILYHEQAGGLFGNAPAVQANGANGANPKATPAKNTSAKSPGAGPAATPGAIPPLRAPQRNATPAQGVAMRP